MNTEELEKAVKCCISDRCMDCPRKKYPAGLADCKDLLYSYIRIAIRNQKELFERENPQPLKLDELKERHGKPVYITNFGRGQWGVVNWKKDFVRTAGGNIIDFNEIADGTFQAYDHEPKEARG